MRLFTDKKLEEFLRDKDFRHFKTRDAMSDLSGYLHSDNDGKVMIINGLRRTGKTTLMYQAISSCVDMKDVMLINCTRLDNVEDIADTILASDKKYVFLDEVTKVPNFIDFASVLSDEAAFSGHKIVMAGTDSLGFAFAKNDELFDRTHEIHTTYIPFEEYHRLIGKDIFQYMKYGGTLTDEKYFYNEDNLEEYTNLAIADNILHTLKYWHDGEYKTELYPAVKDDDVHSLITYFIRQENKQFLAESIEKFKASEYHSPAQIFESRIRKRKRHPELVNDDEHIPDPMPLRDKNLANEWQKMLGIKDDYPFEINDKLIRKLREYLIKLDVLAYVKESEQYYFTQPGMRYCHIDAAIETLVENERIKNEYSAEDVEIVAEKIKEDIEGRLLEDIAFLGIRYNYRANKDIVVQKYRSGNAEYDISLINKRTRQAIAFEVKRSGEIFEDQKKHLNNMQLQEEFERVTGTKVIGKAVLYSGSSGKDKDGFLYINSGEFLADIDAGMSRYFEADLIGA